MFGAILGDMIGAPYEFDRGDKTKEFPLFSKDSKFTDDSVMTIAISEALMTIKEKSDDAVHEGVIASMKKWGSRYPNAGYGGNFRVWLFSNKEPEPYGSFGNGSAMRVSSAGWLYDTLEETRRYAKLIAEVTHNHPEGIKGAEATASAIFMARNGASKEEIKEYITKEFNYDLSRTCDEIRPGYHHVESCQETVPEAITAFLEGENFEDVIRTAVSLGGDCDTVACIAGGIAEAYYGVPEQLKQECRNRLPEDMLLVLDTFDEMIHQRHINQDPFLVGNELIEEAIHTYYDQETEESVLEVLNTIRERMHSDGHLIIPVIPDETCRKRSSLLTLSSKDGRIWYVGFTSKKEYEKGQQYPVISHFIDMTLKVSLKTRKIIAGIVINPWGESFQLTNDLIEKLFEMDQGLEYSVPELPMTQDLLKDGTYLKRAIEICSRNTTNLNMIKLARILRDSYVWTPCNQIMSDNDYTNIEKLIQEAEQREGIDSIVGKDIRFQDEIRFVPDILKINDSYYFPVFSSTEEMGEYGNDFSKVERHFLEAMLLAQNNKINVCGIVINAFSQPFIISKNLFDLISGMESSLEGKE